jgi:predicted nucleic acid-binding protein
LTFEDTGAFLALHRKADESPRDALRLWTKLPPLIVTSNHVVDELATLLGRLAGFRYAADRVAFSFDRRFRDAGFRVIPDTRTGRRG